MGLKVRTGPHLEWWRSSGTAGWVSESRNSVCEGPGERRWNRAPRCSVRGPAHPSPGGLPSTRLLGLQRTHLDAGRGAALLPAAVEHVQQPLELPRAGGVLARHDPEHQHLTGVSGRWQEALQLHVGHQGRSHQAPAAGPDVLFANELPQHQGAVGEWGRPPGGAANLSGLPSARKNKQVALSGRGAGSSSPVPDPGGQRPGGRGAGVEIQAVLAWPPPPVCSSAFKGRPNLSVPQFPLVQSGIHKGIHPSNRIILNTFLSHTSHVPNSLSESLSTLLSKQIEDPTTFPAHTSRNTPKPSTALAWLPASVS